MSEKQPIKTKSDVTSPTNEAPAPVRAVPIRKNAVKPTTEDDGATWTLPFTPHNGQDVTIFPGMSREMDTGIRLEIAEGYEVHVRHQLSRGRKGQYRPCLVLDHRNDSEIRLTILNTTPETMRFNPGESVATMTIVRQERARVDGGEVKKRSVE